MKQAQIIRELEPEEYGQLFLQTKVAHLRFVHNQEATSKAMKRFLDSLRLEMTDL